MKPGIYDKNDNLIKLWAELEKEGLNIAKDCEYFKDDRYIASKILSSHNNVKLVIPDNIKYIREDAFKFCSTLETIVLGESIEEIGISAFDSCENLKNVVFNKNIKILDKGAFEWCYKLELANLPNSLTNIGEYAFCDCYNLKEIHIPASTCNIESSAFVNCENLEKIDVDASNPKYCSKDGILFSKDMRTLVSYPSNKKGKEYIVPKTVTVLEEYSMSYNKNLEKVILPDNLKQIERWAFSNSLLKTYIFQIPLEV